MTIKDELEQLSTILKDSLIELKKKGSTYSGDLNYKVLSSAFSTLPIEQAFDKIMNESDTVSKIICVTDKVGSYAFTGVTDISAVLLMGVKEIGTTAFYGNSTIKEINIYTTAEDIKNLLETSPWGAKAAEITWKEWN